MGKTFTKPCDPYLTYKIRKSKDPFLYYKKRRTQELRKLHPNMSEIDIENIIKDNWCNLKDKTPYIAVFQNITEYEYCIKRHHLSLHA